MSRSQRKNRSICLDVGSRFISVIENLGMSLSAAAKSLDYKNPTTLYAVKRGKSIPDPEKLVLAHNVWKDENGRRLDLHWLLTGEGVPFPARPHANPTPNDDIITLFAGLTDSKKTAIRALIDPSFSIPDNSYPKI